MQLRNKNRLDSETQDETLNGAPCDAVRRLSSRIPYFLNIIRRDGTINECNLIYAPQKKGRPCADFHETQNQQILCTSALANVPQIG
jgi:hypothetical protein